MKRQKFTPSKKREVAYFSFSEKRETTTRPERRQGHCGGAFFGNGKRDREVKKKGKRNN